MEFLKVFDRGGPVMWVILAASVVGVAVLLERLWSLRRSRVMPPDVHESLLKHLAARDYQRAAQFCRDHQNVLCRVVEAGLRHQPAGRELAKEAMEETGRVEMSNLEVGVGALSTVAAIAPLLGLLGTVTGMIKVFRDVAGVSNPAIPLLARGIWEALLTTAAGLTVAIPIYVAYRYVESRIDRHGRDLEEAAVEILDLMFPNDTTTPAPADEPAEAPRISAEAAES